MKRIFAVGAVCCAYAFIATVLGSKTYANDKDNVSLRNSEVSSEYCDTEVYKKFRNLKSDGLLSLDKNKEMVFSPKSLVTTENRDESKAYVEDTSDSYFIKWLDKNFKENKILVVKDVENSANLQAVVGYDDLKTPGITDDVLILMDLNGEEKLKSYSLAQWFDVNNQRTLENPHFYIIDDMEIPINQTVRK